MCSSDLGTFARPGSAAIASLETRFSIDLDADGRIATATAAVEQLRSRILAADPSANAQQPFSAVLSGGPGADNLTAPDGDNVLLTGDDLLSGRALSADTIDIFNCGNAARCTVLIASTTAQPYPNDGDNGFSLVRGFRPSVDELILQSGIPFIGATRTLNVQGSPVTGLGLHVDTNNNGAYDNGDNLIALIADSTGMPPPIIQI